MRNGGQLTFSGKTITKAAWSTFADDPAQIAAVALGSFFLIVTDASPHTVVELRQKQSEGSSIDTIPVVGVSDPVFYPSNDNLTDLGTHDLRFRTLWLGTSIRNYGSLQVRRSEVASDAITEVWVVTAQPTDGTPVVGFGSALRVGMVAAGGVQRNLASLSASWSSGAAGSETAYAQIEVAFGGSLGTCLDFVMADIPDCCVSMISNSAGNGAFIRSHRSSDGPGNYVANTTLTMQPSGTGDFRVLVGASYRFFATNTGTRLLGRLGLFGASEASQPGPYPDVAVSAGIAGADTVDAAAVLSALQDLQNTVNSLMAGLRTYGAIAT